MSTRSAAPSHRAATSPRRALFLLPATAVAVLLGAHGHHSPVPAAVAGTAAAAPAEAETPAASTAAAPTAPTPAVRRSTLSRSASRTDRRVRVVPSRHFVRAKPRPTGPLAASNATGTVAAAMDSTYNVPGHCLEWSREQAGIPSKYMDATVAWEHATGRHPSATEPPRGAAVYWTGGSAGHGHIAISVGGGMVRSSDAGGSGQVATVSIAHITDEWHLEYAGWSDSINGYTIPGVAAA